MANDKEIFEGKTFQDLTKDIYENSQKKKLQIDLLIQEIHGFITTIDDVVMVAPIIKEYMDASIKNVVVIGILTFWKNMIWFAMFTTYKRSNMEVMMIFPILQYVALMLIK